MVVVVAEQLISACASGLEDGGNVGQRRILLCRHNAKRNQLSTATQLHMQHLSSLCYNYCCYYCCMSQHVIPFTC